MRLNRSAYPVIPSSKIAVAVTKAEAKECVADTIWPVTIGAEIAASCPEKLTMPPSVPTHSRGEMSDGTVHATGAAAARPPSERLIQNNADVAVCERAAPRIPSPKLVPTIKTVSRTRFESHPRCMSVSTSHPPITRSVTVANSQGTLV